MLSKKEIKDIQSLSHKKFREELKLFVAEGPKIVSELMQLIPEKIERIYGLAEWKEKQDRIPDEIFTEISTSELDRISQLATPNEVLAIIKQLESRTPSSAFVLYLDTIQDPGNFGTIIRIADWFNIKDIVCSPGCADLYNSKVVQSSMASMARVNVYCDTGAEWLQKQDVPVYAASLDGKPLAGLSKIDKGILIIGNESKGISPELMSMATEKITIPKKGKAESLNAAVATGIILYHLI